MLWATGLGLGLLVVFQNCGEVNFSAIEQASVTEAGNPGPGPEMPNLVEDEITCAEGSLLVDGECVANVTAFTECQSFEELILGNSITEIPDFQRSGGRCYYLKLHDQLAGQGSGRAPANRLAEDVVARRHPHSGDLRAQVYKSDGANPYIISENNLSLNIAGQRRISLTSSRVAQASEIEASALTVDNFILVETLRSGQYQARAFGTQDSPPAQSRPNIHISNLEGTGWAAVPVVGTAPGGVERVGKIDVLDGGNISGQLDLTTRMLDCGGRAQASEMYLIIRGPRAESQ